MNEQVEPMDCTQFGEVIHDLERPGTEGFALREAALAHAESCSQCARLMTETESLDAALRALAGSEGRQQAPPRVEAALIEEFHRRKTAASRSRVRRQVATLSAAAVLLLALGLSLHYWPAHNSNDAPVPNEAAKAPVPAVSTVAAPAVSEQQDALLENQADDSESATDFVRLPYADDPTALEDGAVVRVMMPRAALASFGFPVAAMESGDTVRADMIVSADGTPQAIRLVSQENTSQSF
jgi:hypothetical protein